MDQDSVMVALHFYPEELQIYRERAKRMGLTLERALEATVRAWHLLEEANVRGARENRA